MSNHLSYEFDHVFAFTVWGLIPSLLSSLLIDFAQVTILENMDATTFVESLSRFSPLVTRHTSLIHIKTHKDTSGAELRVDGVVYDWMHPTVRPWGEPMRAQCPQCFSLRAWEQMKDGNNETSRFRCKGRYTHGSSCAYILSVAKPRGAPKVTTGKSVWMSRTWPLRD
jgi:hypothetical protein